MTTTDTNIWQVCSGTNPVLDVIFIHGLTGSPTETWATSDGAAEFWPEWLGQEFPNISVCTIGYPASIFQSFSKPDMNLHERANNMLEQLASFGIGERPIMFITHSLGGLLVKAMLRASSECNDTAWKRIAENTKVVAFLATPHSGSDLARVFKLFFPRIPAPHMTLLSNSDGFLTNLNQAYRDIAAQRQIKTVSYYEKQPVKAVIVVSESSADPGVSGTRPIAVDANHISICKPASRHAMIFISLERHIRELVKTCSLRHGGSPFESDDYAQKSASDRRDLLQKLIDAGREHEYPMANDLQNKFAQKYYKLGLYTEAKSQSDAVLDSVQQRFITHVYNAKICTGASDEEISDALQKQVIDPISKGCLTGTGNITANNVLQALYFLTEQCHIQWDYSK